MSNSAADTFLHSAPIPIRARQLCQKQGCSNCNKPKVLIACGGTGGHLTPGIAWAFRLQEAGYEPILVVSQKKIDVRVLENYPQLEWVQIPGVYLSLNFMQITRWAVEQVKAQWAVRAVFKRTRPVAIYGLGGFTTLTVGLGAAARRTPIFLHAADRIVGRAIRGLSRFAKRVYLPPGVTLPSISAMRQVVANYPLRPEMSPIDRAQARHELGFPETGRLLVILGGSQGASSLNNWARIHFEHLAALGYHLFVSMGLQNFKGPEHLQAAGPNGQTMQARFVPFCDAMATVLSAADFGIARAGAGTLAELEAFRVPAIIIPYPYAKDDHQNANADYFVQRGFGQKVHDSSLGEIMPLLAELSANELPWAQWRKNMENARTEDPLDLMMRDLQELLTARSSA